MIQWVGWVADLDNGRCYPIESSYAKKDDVEKNLPRCIEDTMGFVGRLECHVYTLSQADKRNVHEEMELWARDHDDPTVPYDERNEGFRVCGTITVSPRESDPMAEVRRTARELDSKKGLATRMMEIYSSVYQPTPDEMGDVAHRVSELMRRMAA